LIIAQKAIFFWCPRSPTGSAFVSRLLIVPIEAGRFYQISAATFTLT
jgi:hypothetical protein